MDLMPHIKCLIDDLVSITEDIVVKREDIADSYDNELNYSIIPNYYQQIIDDTFTVNAMTSVPTDVIAKLLEWDGITYKNIDYIQSSLPKIINKDGRRLIYNNKDPYEYANSMKWENINTDDLYIKLDHSSKYMYPIKSKKNHTIHKSIMSNNKYLYPQNKCYMEFNGERVEVEMTLNEKSEKIVIDIPTDLISYEQIVEDAKLSINDTGIDPSSKYYFGRYVTDDNVGIPRTQYVDGKLTILKDEHGDIIYDKYTEFNTYDVLDYTDTNKDASIYLGITSTGVFKECTIDDEYDRNKIYYKISDNGNYEIININSFTYELYVRSMSIYTVYYPKMYIPYSMKDDIYDYMSTNPIGDLYCTIIDNGEFGKFEIANLYVQTTYDDYYIYTYNKNGDEYNLSDDYIFYEKVYNGEEYVYKEISEPNFTISDFGDRYFIYIPENFDVYRATPVATGDTIYHYSTHLNKLDNIHRKQLYYKMKDYITNTYCPEYDFVTNTKIYFGEQNQYYRMLNGLPPVDDMDDQPMINLHDIDSSYDNKYEYLYNLSDYMLLVIETDGTLDRYIDEYPDKTYLRYLGSKRIDCIAARNAEPFDLLRTGTYDNIAHYNLFIEKYAKAKDYIFIKHYFPELYKDQEYYLSFITYLMVTYAACLCITDSGSILINNDYLDSDTVELKLESFGLNIFDNIPLLYRRNIAKNIEKLIHNKAIDVIYDIIYKVFNIHDTNIYKYYFYHKYTDGERSLEMIKIPIDSKSIINSIDSIENFIDYDSITTQDKYWGVYETDESIKKLIDAYDFNYSETKYIGIDIIFDVSKLIMSTSVLLNYILESSEISSNIYIKPSFSENKHTLKDLMIALFAVNAELCGYDGNIPIDILQISQIYKYNLEDDLNKDSRYEKLSKWYAGDDWYNEDSDWYDKGVKRINTDNVISSLLGIEKYNTIRVDKVNNTNKDIDNISTNYLSNSTDEGIYGYIKDSIINSSSYDEYQFYRHLYDCVYKNQSMHKLFAMDKPIFEKIGNISTINDSENGNKNVVEWTYANMDSIWVEISDGYELFVDGDDYCIGYNDELYKAYVGCPPVVFNELDDDIYAYINTTNLDEPKISVNTIDKCSIHIRYKLKEYIESKNFNNMDTMIYDKYKVFSGYNEPENISTVNIPIGSFYVKYDKTDYDYVPKEVYILTDSALSFKSWLRNNNSELYSLIYDSVELNDDTIDLYINSLNELYLDIINAIETAISDDALIYQLNLEYLDYDSISEYIRYVLNVFKSYTIDIATIDAIYSIDDKSKEAIRIFNKLPIIEFSTHSSNINFISTLNIIHSTELLTERETGFKLDDELIIIE